MRISLAQLDFIIGKKINWCAILWINDNDTKEAATFENKRTIFNGMDNKCKIFILYYIPDYFKIQFVILYKITALFLRKF